MNACRDLRARLLEADPRELAGLGPSEVADHVRTCAACGAVAGAILEETAALGRFLAEAGQPPDVEAILTSAGVPRSEPGAAARVFSFPSWRRWSALAAAAAVVGLLLLPADAPVEVADIPPLEGRPLVEVPPDRNVAVLPTANPDITVLWFF